MFKSFSLTETEKEVVSLIKESNMKLTPSTVTSFSQTVKTNLSEYEIETAYMNLLRKGYISSKGDIIKKQ